MDDRPKGRFSAYDRLRKRAEFGRLRETGRRVITANFVFLVQLANEARPPRLGITASRRVGHAVDRNRAKRLVREAFRALRSSWPPGAEVVVIVRGGLGARKLADVVSEWRSARSRFERCFAQLGREAQGVVEGGGARPRDVPAVTGSLPAKKSC